MKKLRITIGDKSYDVTVEVLSDESPRQPPPPAVQPRAAAQPAPPAGAVKNSLPPAGVPLGAGAVVSPLAGVVISILVSEGEATEEGQELIILEAMKMETAVSAPRAGTVSDVFVREGDVVAVGDPLVAIAG